MCSPLTVLAVCLHAPCDPGVPKNSLHVPVLSPHGAGSGLHCIQGGSGRTHGHRSHHADRAGRGDSFRPPLPPPPPPCSVSAHTTLPTRCGICCRHFSLLLSFVWVFCSTWNAEANEKRRLNKAAEQLENSLGKDLSWVSKGSEGSGVSELNCGDLGS